MRLGRIKPMLKIHGVDGNGETACGCGPAKEKWNGKRAEITCLRCDFMLRARGRAA
jgi:hypothetical protein